MVEYAGIRPGIRDPALVLAVIGAVHLFPPTERAVQHNKGRCSPLGTSIAPMRHRRQIIDIDVERGLSHIEMRTGVRIKLLTAALHNTMIPTNSLYNGSLARKSGAASEL